MAHGRGDATGGAGPGRRVAKGLPGPARPGRRAGSRQCGGKTPVHGEPARGVEVGGPLAPSTLSNRHRVPIIVLIVLLAVLLPREESGGKKKSDDDSGQGRHNAPGYCAASTSAEINQRVRPVWRYYLLFWPPRRSARVLGVLARGVQAYSPERLISHRRAPRNVCPCGPTTRSTAAAATRSTVRTATTVFTGAAPRTIVRARTTVGVDATRALRRSSPSPANASP